jgi:hypothetical protein
MVESPDPERTDGTPPVMPRLLAVALVAAIALGGLALIPSQDSPVAEPGLPEALPEPLTEASLLDLSASPEDVAATFMAAWVEGDGRSAATEFASDGLFYSYYAEYERGMLPALRDWYRALGQHYQNVPCRSVAKSLAFCDYTFENKLTQAFGWEPSKGYLEFLVEVGAIEHVKDHFGFDAATGYDVIWDLFLEWVKIRADGNFERMYNSDAGHPILDLASIGLWEHHSAEFAASGPAIAKAQAICRAARDRFDAALAEIALAEIVVDRPGPGLRLFDKAEYSEVAVSISEQAVAELRALAPSGTSSIRFDEIISIWEAHTDFLREVRASAGDGALFRVGILGQGAPSVCPSGF